MKPHIKTAFRNPTMKNITIIIATLSILTTSACSQKPKTEADLIKEAENQLKETKELVNDEDISNYEKLLAIEKISEKFPEDAKSLKAIVMEDVDTKVAQNEGRGDAYEREKYVKNSAIEAVKYHLKDPASAEFRNLKITNTAVCGEVNSKNGFGAMTGFVPFMSGGGAANTFFPENFPKGEFEKTWNQACR